MDWTGRILFLVAVATCVHSHIQLLQSGTKAKKPKASVNVSCKAFRHTFTSCFMRLVQKASGQGL
uniref:Uncharacterized protein n=1 Tax=Balaenoptera musculus TaxID=9771 RepID=A0A8C0E0N9_BALMU